MTNEGAAVEAETVDDGTVMLRIVRGEPTPEELAALVAVIARRAGAGAASERTTPSKPSGWTDRSRYVRPRLWHAPSGWRTSSLPQ